jgi:hypothetical protein
VVAGLRAIAAVAISLLLSMSVVGCASSCPSGFLEGTLVAADGELVVEGDLAGVATHVEWPFGLGVRDDNGELVLSDAFGGVKAREGDVVRIGGSATTDGTWIACGDVTVSGRATPKPPNG